VNSDGAVGTPEVLYILQVLSGLRVWDPELPTVMGTNPSHGAVDVFPNTSVSVQFSEPLEPSSVTIDTCLIQRQDGTMISGEIAVDQEVITFTPYELFYFDTEYTVILKAGIQDLDGSAMPSDYLFTFTTEAPQHVTVSVIGADQYGATLRLEPALPGLLPADIGLSVDGETFIAPEAVSTTDNGANYTVTMPLDACGTYALRLNKLGYAFDSELQIVPIVVLNAAVSEMGVSGFTLALDPPIPQLTAQEVRLEAQGTSETQTAGAVETNDGGQTYRVYLPLAHSESYQLDLLNDCYQINAPPIVQVSEPTLTATIGDISYYKEAGHYVFEIRTQIKNTEWRPWHVPEAVVVLDEDGIPVPVSNFEVFIWKFPYIGIRVTAELKHGVTHLVDLYGSDEPYGGVEITTDQVVTFEVADAWVGNFTIVTDIPLHGLAPENIELGIYNPYTPLVVESVTTSSDGLTHVINAPIDLHTYYQVRPFMPGYLLYSTNASFNYEFDSVFIEERYIEVTVSDVTLDGFTMVPDKPVEGLTIDELELTNQEGGSDPTVESLTTDDNGASYRVRAQLNLLNRYTVGFSRYGYQVLPAHIFIHPETPTAVDDTPGPFSGYTTVHDTDLSVTAESGLLINDDLGIPGASLTRFGGGSLGGAVTDTPAGGTVSLAGGILLVNEDGSFSLTGQPFIPGTYSFKYRIYNGEGTSDATVTLHIQERPEVISTFPAPDAQGVALTEAIRISFNNMINSATVNTTSFEVARDGEPVDGEVVASENTIVFTPDAPFILDTAYAVVLSTAIEDMNGNAMAEEYRFTFRTAGPPEVLSTDPTTGELNVAVDKVIALCFQ